MVEGGFELFFRLSLLLQGIQLSSAENKGQENLRGGWHSPLCALGKSLDLSNFQYLPL